MDIFSSSVEFPQIETLIEISGTAGNPVTNIVFDGITFQGATWLGPSSPEGYVVDQSGFHLTEVHEPNYIGHAENLTRTPGNISIKHASGIEFRNNVFQQLGAVALYLVEGCTRIKIEKKYFQKSIFWGNTNRRCIQAGCKTAKSRLYMQKKYDSK